MTDNKMESKILDLVQRLKAVYEEISSIRNDGCERLENVKNDAMDGLKETMYCLLIMIADDTLESINRLIVENGLESIEGLLIDLKL